MPETIQCVIMPRMDAEADRKNYRTDRLHYKAATIQIIRAANQNSPEMHVIASQRDFFFQLGDRIKAITGTVAVWVKPGTPAGMFALKPNLLPNSSSYRLRAELEINEETTKSLPRATVEVAEDIGSLNTGLRCFR